MKTSTQHDAIGRFWDRYINYLYKQGVKESEARWYVVRCEDYIGNYSDIRLTAHGFDEVNTYFKKLADNAHLEGWQYIQAVGAIQKLFEVLNAPWLAMVDWGFWRDSAQALGSRHPAVACDGAGISLTLRSKYY